MDKSTPIEATPLSQLRPNFANDGNNQTENIPSPTSQVFAPLQTVDDETYYTTTPPFPLASSLQTANDETDSTPIMAIPLSFVPPSDESNTVDVNPNIGPIKRGPGRPKGSRNVKKKKLETCHPNNEEVVVSCHNDETHNTSSPPLVATHHQAIVLYDASNVNDSLANDVDPSSSSIKRGPGRPKGSRNANPPIKKQKTYDPEDKTVTSCPGFDSMITEEEKENGNQELVDSVLMRFDAVRRRLVQVKCAKAVLTTAFSSLNNLGVRTNKKKRIGPVPGVQVGDIFYYWGEMCLVGLHTQIVAGIDSLAAEDGSTVGLATSVVTSGHYNDKTEDLETLIYTGQGGGQDKDGKPKHQELKRGNLALHASSQKGNEVRVIRGVDDPEDSKKKIYIYDGLYVVTCYWIERGTNGCDEYKFNLVRRQNQPSGYATWKLAEEWRKCGSDNDSRKGFVFEDVSLGSEPLPVPIVNEIDENDKNWPLNFNYIASSTSLSMLDVVPNYQPSGCNTCDQGQPCEDLMCPYVLRNGGVLPYDNRILICRKPMIYECGDMCSCPSECKNRLTQTGLKIRVEVFKTERCGWGLRSWEAIRAGTFICELVGTAKRRDEVEEDDEYVFDTSRVYKNFRWNYEPELVGEGCGNRVPEVYKLRSEILVSAKEIGNVSRFMNHSCSANVMWQPVEIEKAGQPSVHIAFFAKKHIPPLTELRYDYGMSFDTGEVDEDGNKIFRGKRVCLCGSEKCCGSFE